MNPRSMTPAQREARRFRPDGWAAIRLADGESVVYYGNNRNGKPAAVAYRGRATKPTWNYYFSSEAARASRVQSFVTGIAAEIERKADALAARKAFRHSLNVGDVLYTSWGYDQTNIDYYQVTRTSNACVWVRAISRQSSGNGWTGDCVPAPGKFIGPETRHRVTPQNSIRIHSFAYASKVDSREVGGVTVYAPNHWTAYA
jgi:hypothetical protein